MPDVPDEASLLELFAQPGVRALFERELAATHPVLSNPQMTFVEPGHFYSPLPDIHAVEALRRRSFESPALDLAGISLREDAQAALLEDLSRFYPEFDWAPEAVPGRRYRLRNNFFEDGDAVMLFLMIRRFAPARIVEVGSGFSSALMLDISDRFYGGRLQLTFIEPHTERLRPLLRASDAGAITLHERIVQDAPMEAFTALEPNDILFIDSSHVSKVGSDVNYLLFSILPRLRPGVLVHVHDIFFPFEYPLEWLQTGRAWNEAYLLRAFLQYNSAFEILLFNNFIARRRPEFVRDRLPLMAVNPGGSLWLRKTA